MSVVNDRQIAAIWVWAGPLLLLYTVGTFSQTRSPGAAAFPGAPTLPAGNVETSAYWGALIGAAGLALLSGLAANRIRRSTEFVWWRRLPLAPLENTNERSAALSIGALCAFIVVPAIAVTAMSIRFFQTSIVFWNTGNVAANNLLERISLIRSTCAWVSNQCFRLGNTSGIEYKPMLTDGVLLIAIAAAIWQLFRLVFALNSSSDLDEAST